MIESRVKYGIDKFLEDNYFLPNSQIYHLEEKSESGRSELLVKIDGDNLCSEDYDHKGKCNFLKESSPLKLKRSVDHVILQKKEKKWIAHFIEMKSQVDNKKWVEIKQKTRASYFNICAIEKLLGIHIDEFLIYTTYEKTRFTDAKNTSDPKAYVPPLGKPAISPKMEWEKNEICVDIGEIVKFKHQAIKMERTEDNIKLVGNLHIYGK